MKTIKQFAGAAVILFATNCYGSEVLATLEHKVQESDLVVIGTVTKVRRGDIRVLPGYSSKTQETDITFRIDECISGQEKGEILIKANSVSFSTGTFGQHSSAGFSSDQIEPDGRFIAYLKKTLNGFVLAGQSNQYLEPIDDLSVRDVGQTSRMVSLDLKKKELAEFAARKQKKKPNKSEMATPRKPSD